MNRTKWQRLVAILCGRGQCWGAAVGLVWLVLVLESCEHRQRVHLTLDFSTRPQWCYRLNIQVDVGSGLDTASRGTSEATGVFCVRAEAADPTVVNVVFESLEISSAVLHPAEIEHARWRLTSSPVRFRVRDGGTLTAIDSGALSEMQFGGWDLYRVIARTVPSLPMGAVHVGQSWERDYAIELHDALSPAAGHLYQAYRLDSVGTDAAGTRLAYLSWSYVYRLENRRDSGAALPPFLTAGGRGTGAAVLDLSAKALRRATVNFRVPDSSHGRPLWREQAEIVPLE